MENIVVTRARDRNIAPEILHSMYGLRHRVFRERLNWQVDSHSGLERDLYDELNPVYVICLGSENQAEGCVRLLPTMGRYMLKNTFASLLRGETAPVAPGVWELSRFAVEPTTSGNWPKKTYNDTTLSLMQNAYEFAIKQGIRAYVAVTNIAFERLLQKLGLPIRRLGDGQAQRVGKDVAVGVRIEINERCRDAVYGHELCQISGAAA